MKAISTDILPVERACPSRGYVVRTKARRGTTAYWSAIRDYIPADGEIIVYSDYKTLDEKNIPGVKIGTGVALLQDLPFIDDADAADIAAKYTKPAAGIPKTDLDSSVQASLDKADAALPADAAFKTINGESVKGTGNINTGAIRIQNSPRLVATGDVFDEYFGASAYDLLDRGICGYADGEESFSYIYYKVSGNFSLEDYGDGPTVVFDDGATRSTITTRDEDGTIYVESLSEEPSKVELQQSLTPGSTTKAPSITAVKNRIEPIEAKIPAEATLMNQLADKAYVNSAVAVCAGKIEDIEDLIPDQASASNKLADKAFVNSSVQTATANFRGDWETIDDVPIHASEYPADYAGGHTPTVNDYLVVRDMEDIQEWTYGETYSTGAVVIYQDYAYICIYDDVVGAFTSFLPPDEETDKWQQWLFWEQLEGTWRFKYTGNWDIMGKAGWQPEYQVNETPLTAAQLAALNSGITSSKVSQYDGYAQSKQDAADRIVSTPSSSDLASTSKYPSMKTAADYIAATAVCSTTIRTMVTLTQAEYDALANKDANTFYIII